MLGRCTLIGRVCALRAMFIVQRPAVAVDAARRAAWRRKAVLVAHVGVGMSVGGHTLR